MGTQGFCRITAVHLQGLLKRYRQLLGELRYFQKHHPLDWLRIKELQQACISLEQSLQVCAPELDLSSIQPIHFLPPSPLPGAALTRAVLGELRGSTTAMSIEMLTDALIAKHCSAFDMHAHLPKLRRRVLNLIGTLERKGIADQSKDGWAISGA
jgi:hypothetical protein